MNFKVECLQDETYQVLAKQYDDDGDDWYWDCVHQGNLSDCEAYIRLSEGGYL